MKIPVHHGIQYPRFVIPLLFALQSLPSAVAGNGSWTGPRSGSWEDPSNWADNTIAAGVGAAGTFDGGDLTGSVTITLDGPKTAGGLVFGNPESNNDWVIRTGTGGPLTLNAGSAVPSIHIHNRTANLGLNLAGSAGVAKDGPGALVLSGSNSYSGPTKILNGTLRVSAPPRFPTAMKIMPLGDSITYGYNGFNAGYRGPLYYLLNPLAPDFRYVGTSQTRPGLLPPGPLDQRYHEGHSSYNLQDVFNNLDGFDNTRFLLHGGVERNPNGGHWLIGGNGTGRPPVFPDAITMMLGTNDLDNPVDVGTRLHNLIDKITTLRPDTTLLVAKITPAHVPPAVNPPDPITLAPLHPAVLPYNDLVESEVTAFRSAGKKVHLVDLCSNFPPTGLIPDGGHPNDTGFGWMAIQWYDALISAFTPAGETSPALPAATDVTISTGGVLDLDGYQATILSLEDSGILDLGNSGTLAAQSIRIARTGVVSGNGTLQGNVIHNSPALGSPGGTLSINGTFTNNGTIGNAQGSALHFNGNVINNGTLALGPQDDLSFAGSLTNNGVIRVTRTTMLQTTGPFINNGILDVMTGPQAMPANLVNHGLILDAGDVGVHSSTITQQTVTLTTYSYSGHDYQLQRSMTLEDGSWENVGESQPGKTGYLLQFHAPRDAAAGKSFYRIAVD